MDRFGALGLLDILDRLASDGDAEGYWAMMESARQASEERLPTERGGSGFSGAMDGSVIRAPWRGEHDMPGNFERGQRTGNSLVNDALLREGLSHEYEYDPEYGVDAVYQVFGPINGAPMLNDTRQRKIHWSGPPDPGKMWQHPFTPALWDPNYDGPVEPRDWIWERLLGR
jgi:hypothetical protein